MFNVRSGERGSLETDGVSTGVLKKKGFSVTYITNSKEDSRDDADYLDNPAAMMWPEAKSPWECVFLLTGRFTRPRRLILVNKALEKVALVNSKRLVVDTSSNTPPRRTWCVYNTPLDLEPSILVVPSGLFITL